MRRIHHRWLSIGAAWIALAMATPGCNCGGCYDTPRPYPVSDAEIATLVEGTASPTQNGCRVVCVERRNAELGAPPVHHSDGGLDAGFVDAATLTSYWTPLVGCSLAGHELTCLWHECAL